MSRGRPGTSPVTGVSGALGTTLSDSTRPPLLAAGSQTAPGQGVWTAVFLVTFAMALGLRAPFALAPGFGLDSDAWLLAESARRIATEGVWVPSRPPGYPLVELALAPLVGLGPAVTNLASAALAALAAALGAVWLARRGAHYAWAMPLAAVGLPAIALPAASTMDHTFALALLAGALVAFDARSSRRACYAAGVLLGLAFAARPPLGVIAPVFLWRALALDGRVGLTRFAVGLAPGLFWVAASVARCTYWPRPLQADAPSLGLTHALECAGPGALGVGGVAALAALFVAPWLRRAQMVRSPGQARLRAANGDVVDRLLLTGSIALAAGQFALFPLEPNYLAPVCLLGALVLGLNTTPRLALVAALVVNVGGYAAPTIGGIVAGPWRKDQWARESQAARLADMKRVLSAPEQEGSRVVGEDAAALRFLMHDVDGKFEYELTAERGLRIEAREPPGD